MLGQSLFRIEKKNISKNWHDFGIAMIFKSNVYAVKKGNYKEN
jgi:hypothetical protein